MRACPSSDVKITVVVPAIAPAATAATTIGFPPACRAASSIPEPASIVFQGTSPTQTTAIARYKIAPTIKEPMIPNGRSRAGSRHSSDATVTVSKPMYAKNTSAAEVTIPRTPSGANGMKSCPRMAPMHASTNTTIAPICSHTIALFVEDDSLIPIASRIEMTTTIANARTSMLEPPDERCAVRAHSGSVMPNPPSTFCAYEDHDDATGAALIPYSRIRSQPMIHATISPSVAYAYVYALPATGTMHASSE